MAVTPPLTLVGLAVWLAMMATAFLGYVLPWGLMSFWALTVITNLLTVIPAIGLDVVVYSWGGYYISGLTLQRVLAIHYLLPFLLLVLLLFHLLLLHTYGSGAPAMVPSGANDGEPFTLYLAKDLYVIGTLLLGLLLCIVGYPDTLHHPDNHCYMDRYTTPQHIVPEWYFLPFYSMLRACSAKGLGVLLLVAAILLYAVLCTACGDGHTTGSSSALVDVASHATILWVLGLLGQCAPAYPYVECSGLATLLALCLQV